MRHMRRIAWLMVGAALLAGCNQTNSSSSDTSRNGSKNGSSGSGALFAKAHPPIADLPVPFGFDLDEGRSRHWTVGSIRLVDHVYEGSADKFVVARFYRTQMPINRWELVRDVFAQGDILLDFDKGNERCDVVISENGWGNRLKIKVLLTSSGKIPSAGSARNTHSR
jgi:predicted small secreted protein